MFYACVQRFDVTGNLKILEKFLASKRCLSDRENEERKKTASVNSAAGAGAAQSPAKRGLRLLWIFLTW
jgi:hypothetical protein